MIKILISSLLIVASSQAFAGISEKLTYRCKVVGFDEKIVRMNCDPSTASLMKTPREWIADKSSVRAGQLVEFTVDKKQREQWSSLNKVASRTPASKRVKK